MNTSSYLALMIPCLLCQGVCGSVLVELKKPLVQKIADLVRVILRVTRPFSDTVLDIIYTFIYGRTKELPVIDNKILLMSATQLAEKIRKRELTSEEVVRAYVDRAKAVNPLLNAFVDNRFDDAINEAIAVDKGLKSSNKTVEEIAKETPLLGAPFTVKEGIGSEDLANTWGIVRDKDHKASFDADAVIMYRKAGAIPLTVTNDPELLMWWETANHVFGQTRSPYSVIRSVGGSSGGEATLITSAGAVFGIGNDVAGSIRIPSSFCGIYGHKPSRGIVSNYGDTPLNSTTEADPIDQFVSTGPMCRYAEDLPLLMKVLTNNDARLQLDQKVDFKNVTVYYMKELPGYLKASVPEVKKAVKKAVNHFKTEFGIEPIELKIDAMYYAQQIWESKLLEAGNPPLAAMLAGEGNTINLQLELVKNLLGLSVHTLPAIYNAIIDRRDKDKYYYKYLQEYQVIEQKMNETLQGKNAILLLPTHPEPPPHYLMTIPKYPNIGYTQIFNILGLPSTNIPAGLSSKRLPFGLQAVSGMFNDRLCLAAALELDKLFKGWQSPGPIQV